MFVTRALALALLGLLVACSSHAQTPCQTLSDAYSWNSDGTARPTYEALVYGRARTVRVYHDERASGRAAAALFLATLRSLLRYRRVEMEPLPSLHMSPMCALASRLHENCTHMDAIDRLYDNLAVSPALAWSGARCMKFEQCMHSDEVQPRLEALGEGAAPASLRLHAALTPSTAARTACLPAAQFWDFYTDNTRLYNCNFTQDDRFSTLATIYTLSDQIDANNDFSKRIAAAKLKLNLTLLDEDAQPRTELFRLLKERKSSFLFIDYDIWDGMSGVYKVQLPPPTAADSEKTFGMRSLRLADGYVLRHVAPQILQALQHFMPTSKDIRGVLEIEATNPQLGIKEAACSWAIEHNATFETWYQKNYKPQHSIAVFLCVNDPDKEEHKKAAHAVENIYASDSEVDIGLNFVDIDCRHENRLSDEFMKISFSSKWKRLIGVVAPGGVAGARAASELAPGLETALVLYGAPAARVRLGHATRATSGTLHQLVATVQHFLDSFRWARLTVLSDETELAQDLLESFRSNSKLKIYNAVINSSITDTLQVLRSLNARIFFVNTSPDVAQKVICAAHNLSMMSTAEYVWILREWRTVGLECGEGSVSYRPNMTLYTVSFSWRGGNYTQLMSSLSTGNGSNILRITLDELWPGGTWPPLAAPLADSIELLIKSLKRYTRLHPERYFDLHGHGSVRLLLDQNHQINGVMQNLEYVNGTLSHPLIFMDRWIGNQRELLSIWRIQDDKVKLINNMKHIFGYNRPSDGARICLTNTSEIFYPRCDDFVWFAALGFLILTVIALYLSRRVRLKRLTKRDALLKAQLLAQREFVSNALENHYVDRAALELYDYLSQGSFGRIRYAILRAPERQPISVAVKELRDDVPMTEESELLREACTLATLCHDHIVRLIGVCATGGPLLVLLEYAFFGNLREYLCERRYLVERATELEVNDESYHVTAPSLTRLAKEVTSALAYLAVQRLVHRDIRASNCLVDARRSLKLADFGLARNTGTGVAGEEEYLTRRRGLFPVLWMAPESLERGVFSAASDVWGLGVLLLELATLGARPYGAWPPERVLRYVSAGGRPPLPPDISESTRSILMQCWRRTVERRPAAAALAALLEAEPAALRPAMQLAPEPNDEACPAIDE